MRLRALAVALAALPTLASAQGSPGDDLSRGIELRRAGRPAEAIPLLQAATQAHSEDADAWLNLGLAYSATGRLSESEQALQRAERLAPSYPDVQLGLARLAYFRGDYGDAERRLASVLERAPDSVEARELSARVAQARRNAGLPWRLDATATYGELSKGLKPTRIGALSASRQLGDGKAIAGALEHVEQFRRRDTYLEAAISRRGAYLALGGTPDAEFRPEWSVRGGLSTPAPRFGAWAGDLAIDAGWARYPTGDVRSFHPSLTVRRREALSLTARWINVLDENDDYRTGYALRAVASAAPRLRFSAAWSAAPESGEGRTVRVKAVGLGAAFDFERATTLRADGVHEMRPAYDRDLVSLGLTRRF